MLFSSSSSSSSSSSEISSTMLLNFFFTVREDLEIVMRTGSSLYAVRSNVEDLSKSDFLN